MKTIQPIFTKFSVQVANGPPKNPLDFDGNLNQVTFGWKVRVTFGLGSR